MESFYLNSLRAILELLDRGSTVRGIILLFVGILLMCHPVHAADSYWTNSAGGTFSTPGNWNPGVPTAADNANFTNNASYTVSWSANAANANAYFNPAGGTVIQDISASSWL